MAVTGLGDMSYTFQLRRQSADLKALTQRLSTEVSTGLVNDPARRLSGDLVPLSGIETSMTRLTAYEVAAAEAALFAGGMQETLATVDTLAGNLAPSLLSAAASGHVAMVRTTARDAADRFDSAVSALNTRVGDRTLFAGTAADRPALAPAEQILAALETLTTGLATAAEVEAAVVQWFGDPAGFAAVAYRGGDPLAPLAVSPEDSVTFDVTAGDPAFRDTLQGFALAALIDRGAGPALPSEQAALARRAGEMLLQGSADRADLAARIGTVEGRIETARQRNTAETSALEIARAALLSADPYETATRLEAAQGQLEALYAVTARLSRLSLLEFLR